MSFKSGLLSFLLSTLSLAGLTNEKKVPKSLEFSLSQTAFVNYSSVFQVECYLTYNNGKKKEITGKDELTVSVTGPATYSRGKIYVDAYPQKLCENTIRIKGAYKKDKISLETSLEIPFNYKGDIELNFSGTQGSSGQDGAKGSTQLVFRDGNKGEDGGPGGEGSRGDNLTVYVWQDSVDFYFIKVNNLTSGKTYIYKIKENGYGFRIKVNGGKGGKGGKGGNGGDGKNGSSNNGKTKLPGNGGNGGSGGMGGTGGNGGDVYVFIHPNASSFQSKIAVYNFGGTGGDGGDAGKGGAGGSALEGQTAGTKGTDGASGTPGYSGLNSTVFQILVEEFDIEY